MSGFKIILTFIFEADDFSNNIVIITKIDVDILKINLIKPWFLIFF